MALSLICACGAHFEVEDTLFGQDVACPECQQIQKAPVLRKPAQRTSELALVAAVVALVGLFTIIGTVAAVVLGSIALLRIRRSSEYVGGTGFALFAIIFGTLFTGLTLFALSIPDLGGIGGWLRRIMLGDRVDTLGSLTHEDKTAGFRITRPSRDWAVSTVDRLEDASVTMLQGPNPRKLDLLLVQMQHPVYVDVSTEQRLIVDVDKALAEAVDALRPSLGIQNPPNPFQRDDEESRSALRVTRLEPLGSTKTLQAGNGIEAREREVMVHFPGHKWKMLVRVYLRGERCYILRAYGRSLTGDSEKDVRKLLDSFTILDGN